MDSGDGSPSALNLALLYEGLLTGIARPQASRQHISDGETFRKRTKVTLKEIEHVAVPAGYDGQDVSDTHFAVVALLDSVVLHSNDAVRAEWERKTFEEELFGQAYAGQVFSKSSIIFFRGVTPRNWPTYSRSICCVSCWDSKAGTRADCAGNWKA